MPKVYFLLLSAFDTDRYLEVIGKTSSDILDKTASNLFVQMSGLVNFVGEDECVLAEYEKFTKGWTNGKNF